MSLILTIVRNVSLTLAAFVACAGIATELIAALGGFRGPFGAADLHWLGLPLHHPFAFLRWSFAAHAQPWTALFAMLWLGACGLVSLAVLTLLGWITPPIERPGFRWRRFYARWPEMSGVVGQQGSLRAKALALGAVRRHPFARLEPVAAAAGNTLIVGDPANTNTALLAALARWSGALVVVDGGSGLSLKLKRTDALRWAPGRPDSLSFNPMLSVRDGAHAWADAQRLARALLGPAFLSDAAPRLVDAFAMLALDQLIAAPVHARSLAGLRKRLADPNGVLHAIATRWGDEALSESPRAEMARAAQTWAESPTLTLDALRQIDDVLSLFEDGAYAQATDALQLSLADLVADDGPTTFVISPPPDEAKRAAPLIRALLSELAATCASAPDIDQLGRAKKRELLIVLDAEASAALAGEAIMPAHACARGVRLIAEARCVAKAPAVAFHAVAAIGPQTDATAQSLSQRGGTAPCWRQVPSAGFWRNVLLPEWRRDARAIIAERDLTTLKSNCVLLFFEKLAPVAALALNAPAAATAFIDGRTLAPVAHAWSALPVSASMADPAEPPPARKARPRGADIRKALARRAPPSVSKGPHA